MQPWARRMAMAVPVAAALVACAPAPAVRIEPGFALPEYEVGLASTGPHEVRVGSGRLDSAYGCVLRYELHEPVADATRTGATVVLAHGFLRDLRSMRGWASHLASHGVRAVAVSLCNSTPFDGRHARNAEDLAALAAALTPPDTPLVYAGFSAGGLAAYLAAASDPRAVAYLGLDAVDSGGLAGSVAPIEIPALFLAAEPSRCNAGGNFVPLARDLPDARVTRVAHATHCDFENPTSAACERVCGRVEPPAVAASIRQAIRSQATAWILEHVGAH